MVRASRIWMAALVVLLVATGCQTLTGETLGQNIDDNTITASVKAKLVADKAANFTRVHVTTERGTVYLTGVVDSAAQRTRVETLAAQVSGVRRVVNNLQLRGR